VASMIKVLEDAIEKVKTLSEERQHYAAHVLDQIAGAGDDVYRLSREERCLVREGTADLDAGRIVTDPDMDAFWRRNRP
jgi:hypothetical protein